MPDDRIFPSYNWEISGLMATQRDPRWQRTAAAALLPPVSGKESRQPGILPGVLTEWGEVGAAPLSDWGPERGLKEGVARPCHLPAGGRLGPTVPEQPSHPVLSDRDTQLARLMRRNGLNREDAEARIKAQLPLKDKVRMAHHVLDNSGEWSLTKRQVVLLHGELERSLEYLPLRLGVLTGLAGIAGLLYLLTRYLLPSP